MKTFRNKLKFLPIALFLLFLPNLVLACLPLADYEVQRPFWFPMDIRPGNPCEERGIYLPALAINVVIDFFLLLIPFFFYKFRKKIIILYNDAGELRFKSKTAFTTAVIYVAVVLFYYALTFNDCIVGVCELVTYVYLALLPANLFIMGIFNTGIKFGWLLVLLGVVINGTLIYWIVVGLQRLYLKILKR